MPKTDSRRQLIYGLMAVLKAVDSLALTAAAAPRLAVLVLLLLFAVLIPLLLDYSLAILASCGLVMLFVYVHNVVEGRYFSKAFFRKAKTNQAAHWVILANRLVMLCLFMFFESLLLAHWGLYDPKSPGLFIYFWLVHLFVLVWVFDPPSELSSALSTESRSTTTLAMIVIVALAVFCGDLGGRLADNQVLQNVAFGVVMAVFLAAVLSSYDRGMKSLVKRNQ